MFEFQSIGTDAEVFWTKNGKPFPVCGLLGGTKASPKPIPELGNGFMIQEDNVTAEFNIPPCTSAKEFSAAIGKQLDWVSLQAKLHGCEVAIQPSFFFDPKDLESDQAQLFGCDPELHAWDRKQVRITDEMRWGLAQRIDNLLNLRTAAAHIHVGYTLDGKVPESVFDRERVVKMLDIAIGIPLSLIETSRERLYLYGNFGAFRSKPYGLEYRSPSNLWIKRPEMREWVFHRIQNVMSHEIPSIEALEKYSPYISTIFNFIKGRTDLWTPTTFSFVKRQFGGLMILTMLESIEQLRSIVPFGKTL